MVEEPTSGTHQVQGAPTEEPPKPGNPKNNIAKATISGTAGEETPQTTNRLADTAKTLKIDEPETHAQIAEGVENNLAEAICASMAG